MAAIERSNCKDRELCLDKNFYPHRLITLHTFERHDICVFFRIVLLFPFQKSLRAMKHSTRTNYDSID